MVRKRRSKTSGKAVAAIPAVEKLAGGPLTLGRALAAIRQCEEQSLAQFARMIGVSRAHLCDIEKGRRLVSPERAARFAQSLQQSETQFVRLALQDQVRAAGLAMTVDVRAA